MAFPDGAFAGQKVPEPVTLLDLLPTLLEVAGLPPEGWLPMDGRSLLDLLAGRRSAERPILSEYHLEKVQGPCFMVRRGSYKYIYIHGYDCQLFDLAVDPGEWHNLAGQPALQAIEDEFRGLILAQFDPERIAAEGAASIRRREVIKVAMQRNDTHWDYTPVFDATRQYVR
jgi:choline-sulfatase